MLNITVEKTLPFDAETVWALLADFGNIGWATGDNRVDIVGEGIGMIRRIIIEGMEPIDEVLDSLDHDAKILAYSIPNNIPLPVSDYNASAQVIAQSDNSCQVIWRGQFSAQAGTSDEEAKTIMMSMYEQLISWVEAYLKKTAPA